MLETLERIMDPLITNGVGSVTLGGLEKRSNDHDALPRNKRRPSAGKTIEEENEVELGIDVPKHAFDDLA